MAKEKPGVMIYWETFDMFDRLKVEKLKPLLCAIRNFSRYGEVPDFNGDESLELVWPLIQQKIAADSERYEKIREQRINAINSRWEKEKIKAQEENDSIQPNTTVYESERNIPTSPTSPTAEATASTTAEKGKRDNEEMENGVTSHTAPVPADNPDDDFERRRQEQIAKMREYVPGGDN